MTADTFLSMLLAREWDYRAQAAIARLTKNAAFRYKAYIEQVDYATNRGLERNQMERLATLDFVHKAQNLFITGSSGTGKSYLAIRHRTFSLPVLQERGKAVWPAPPATKHAKGDSVPYMPMPRNCPVR